MKLIPCFAAIVSYCDLTCFCIRPNEVQSFTFSLKRQKEQFTCKRMLHERVST